MWPLQFRPSSSQWSRGRSPGSLGSSGGHWWLLTQMMSPSSGELSHTPSKTHSQSREQERSVIPSGTVPRSWEQVPVPKGSQVSMLLEAMMRSPQVTRHPNPLSLPAVSSTTTKKWGQKEPSDPLIWMVMDSDSPGSNAPST
jgi:hypothetical protein